MHKYKLQYVISYGLGPLFQQNLMHGIKSSQFYAVSFDKSVKEIVHKVELDLGFLKREVCTYYLTSVFLEDLVTTFMMETTNWKLCLQNIIQNLFNDAHIHLKFLPDLQCVLGDCDGQ
ncbi:hypothetical protein PR048_028580, partial [Dryococelus australis]